MKKEDFIILSKEFNFPASKIETVITIEAMGSGFDKNGNPKVLFEPHLFHKNTGGKYRLTNPDLSTLSWKETKGIGSYKKNQWDLYLKAFKLDPIAAIKSTSWGVGQLIGENFAAAGFKSPSDFVEAMKSGELAQARAMMRFILSNKAMKNALEKSDWKTFAKLYNGPGYAENKYDTKLSSIYEKIKAAGTYANENKGLIGFFIGIGIIAFLFNRGQIN